MLLYHYINEQYGLEAIRSGRLKVSRFNTLNDPFDHIGLYVDGPEQRNILELERQTLNDTCGIICFSFNFQMPLLWGHYADNHRGMCLIFEIKNNGSYHAIDYPEERTTLADYGVDTLSALSDKDRHKILHQKYIAWEYEAEVRRHVLLGKCTDSNGNLFCNFDEDMKLVGALFGFRSKISNEELGKLFKRENPITFSFVRPSERYFKLELDNELNARRIPARLTITNGDTVTANG